MRTLLLVSKFPTTAVRQVLTSHVTVKISNTNEMNKTNIKDKTRSPWKNR